MIVTEEGMCISINEEYNRKESFSICFTDEGIVISKSEEQSIYSQNWEVQFSEGSLI